MNLEQYQKAALRTESIVDTLNLNPTYITLLLKLFTINADILDAVKKEVYYKNSKKSNETVIVNLSKLENLIREAKYAFSHKDDHSPVTLDPRVFHGIIGMATEAGELVEVLVKNLESGTSVDAINVQEEMNDSNWYQAILNETLTLDWETGLKRNIAKLFKRYPEKFSEVDAETRNLIEERNVLEGSDI